MKSLVAGVSLVIIGTIMLIFATYSIILTVYNYKMILPTTLSQFIDYYFGTTFKSINDVIFLGVLGACGAVLCYFGFLIIYMFRK